MRRWILISALRVVLYTVAFALIQAADQWRGLRSVLLAVAGAVLLGPGIDLASLAARRLRRRTPEPS